MLQFLCFVSYLTFLDTYNITGCPSTQVASVGLVLPSVDYSSLLTCSVFSILSMVSVSPSTSQEFLVVRADRSNLFNWKRALSLFAFVRRSSASIAVVYCFVDLPPMKLLSSSAALYPSELGASSNIFEL